ncbi:hypothetical protein IV55_GL000696 [Furfurilactobacillus siliginis]|nr:hypothetical protein IV55_GL000696 [Furfurilactobacillus siliginis]
MYLRSLERDGKLMFNNYIPFDATTLAAVTRHSVGDVEKAIDTFKRLGLIEVLDNGAIYMADIQNYIGRSSTEADRKRKYRASIDAEKQEKLPAGHLSDKRPPEKELEIEKEIEKDISPNSDKQNSGRENIPLKLAEYLFEKIKTNNPKAREPNLTKWANVIRLMIAKDNRDVQEITDMIDWCQSVYFWKTTILSPESLRKNFDAMIAKRQEASESTKPVVIVEHMDPDVEQTPMSEAERKKIDDQLKKNWEILRKAKEEHRNGEDKE